MSWIVWELIKWGLLSVGGAACCWNAYLSFLRYPLHRWRGGTRENYKWDSGVPMLGSLFVAVVLKWYWDVPFLRAMCLVLIAIDTGGLHWAVVSMIIAAAVACVRKARSPRQPP